MRSLAIYCGSSDGNKTIFKEAAFALGLALANHSIQLIYGGAKVGLMGVVANAVIENNGKVIGVLPHFLAVKELKHDSLDTLILVDDMHQRKAKMSELAEGFIALPGGFGTLEELFEMLTWAQLSLHIKPIGLLNVDGYYDTLLQFIDDMTENGFLKKSYQRMLLVSSDIEDLLAKMKDYKTSLNNE